MINNIENKISRKAEHQNNIDEDYFPFYDNLLMKNIDLNEFTDYNFEDGKKQKLFNRPILKFFEIENTANDKKSTTKFIEKPSSYIRNHSDSLSVKSKVRIKENKSEDSHSDRLFHSSQNGTYSF